MSISRADKLADLPDTQWYGRPHGALDRGHGLCVRGADGRVDLATTEPRRQALANATRDHHTKEPMPDASIGLGDPCERLSEMPAEPPAHRIAQQLPEVLLRHVNQLFVIAGLEVNVGLLQQGVIDDRVDAVWHTH